MIKKKEFDGSNDNMRIASLQYANCFFANRILFSASVNAVFIYNNFT